MDTLLTVLVIHQLVIAYWRGVWEIFDVQVLPLDPHMSAIICLIIAYTLHAFLCLLQPVANVFYRAHSSRLRRWALETFTFFIANLISVTHWRGVWLLLNHYILPDNPGLSAAITHSLGLTVLWLMMCGHSVTVAGCGVDGQSPSQEGCLVGNNYMRLFVSQPPAASTIADLAAMNPQTNSRPNPGEVQSKF